MDGRRDVLGDVDLPVIEDAERDGRRLDRDGDCRGEVIEFDETDGRRVNDGDDGELDGLFSDASVEGRRITLAPVEMTEEDWVEFIRFIF